MSDISGSIRKLILSGITFNVFADGDFSEIVGAYENEAVPTSGPNVIKKVRRSGNVEGVTVVANGAERALLEELANQNTPFTMSYTTAGDDTFKNEGTINIVNRSTADNKMSIVLMPLNPQWEAFLAA